MTKKSSKKNPTKASGKAMARRMPNIHPYTATLLDPFSIRGVRIPDQNTMPSSVVSYTYRVDLTPVIQSGQGSDPTQAAFAVSFRLRPRAGIVYSQPTVSTYTGDSLTMGAVPEPDLNLYGLGTNLISQFRVVSAGLAVYSNAPSLQNKGKFYVGFTPPGKEDVNIKSSAVVGFADLINTPYVKTCPVSKGMVCSVNYRPATEDAFEYQPWAVLLIGPVAEQNRYPFGTLFACGAGLAAGSPITVTYTVNYEYLPLLGTTQFIPTEPSTYSVRAIEQAANLDWSVAAFREEEDSVFSASMNQSSWSSNLMSSAWQALSGSMSGVQNYLTNRLQQVAGRTIDYGLFLGWNRLMGSQQRTGAMPITN